MSAVPRTPGDPILEVRGLRKHFPLRRGLLGKRVGTVKAVDGVSFSVGRGETLALVGESGCGKTTAARALLGLLGETGGEVLYRPRPGDGPVDLARLGERALRPYRREIQIVFQDPFSSLNPRMSVGQLVGEALVAHRIARGAELERRVGDLLERVGLDRDARERFPHEFSGGQRQRIGIARALALEPRLVVCDEAVSALDVSIQAQVLNLLAALKRDLGLSYLFIAHDLSVVRHVADRIAVMYLGRIVETGTTDEIFGDPRHPYTRALLSAVPVPDPRVRRESAPLAGEVPSPIDPPSGCHFRTRCPLAEARCAEAYPEERPFGRTHSAACHVQEPAREEA